MSNINLRKMMAPKAEPLFAKDASTMITSVHPIQKRMMDFYEENNRCVITAPRRCGKSAFIIMQSFLTDSNSLIISPNSSMNMSMKHDMRKFMTDNGMVFESNMNGFRINGKIINIVSHANANSFLVEFNGLILIDEYDMIDMRDLNVINKDKVCLVGTPTGRSSRLTVDQIGLFAGLNVNEG